MAPRKHTTAKKAGQAKTLNGKSGRLNMRVAEPVKATLERAAAYTRESLSDYVVSRALVAAETDIRTYGGIVLAEGAWDAFFEAFNKPPKAGAAMRSLLKEHDKMVLSR